jgi:hypothetical protein
VYEIFSNPKDGASVVSSRRGNEDERGDRGITEAQIIPVALRKTLGGRPKLTLPGWKKRQRRTGMLVNKSGTASDLSVPYL